MFTAAALSSSKLGPAPLAGLSRHCVPVAYLKISRSQRKPRTTLLVRLVAAPFQGMETSQASQMPTPSDAIDFLELMHELKEKKRTGWVLRNVPEPESIADHMYRMATMSLLLAGAPGVDFQRCMMMAVVHDLAEAIVGDLTPHCGVRPEEKKRREAEAVQSIKQTLGVSTRAAALVEELWLEYEGASSPTAQLVKDFDKCEMILQAFEYERKHRIPLDEFFTSTAGKFKTPVGRQWASEVCARRDAMWQARKDGDGSGVGGGSNAGVSGSAPSSS